MQALDSQAIDSDSETASAAVPASEAQSLAALLDEVAADAEVRAPGYLKQAVVPEGGE